MVYIYYLFNETNCIIVIFKKYETRDFLKKMPATINPIRKALVKKSLLEGKSIRQSLKDGGYSERVAHGNCDKDFPVVKSCMGEIIKEISFKDLTPEHFTKRSELIFSKAVDRKKPDLTNGMRALEFQGRISGIDRQSPSTIINFSDAGDVIVADTDGLTRLARGRTV